MSTKTKFTPGPWRAHGELINSDSREICIIENYSSKKDKANAALIAAAPELMAFAEWVLDSGYFTTQAQAVIDKATGVKVKKTKTHLMG